ncbi:MAG: hypothetical protein LM573_03675 [Thermofilum sp.]|nr:hypothetical protein [Thermofilum sp.]
MSEIIDAIKEAINSLKEIKSQGKILRALPDSRIDWFLEVADSNVQPLDNSGIYFVPTKSEPVLEDRLVAVDGSSRRFSRPFGSLAIMRARSAVGEVEYVEYVSGALERVARSGRVRQIGLILSTHSTKDVHSPLLNLCNNKVIFGLDPSLLEELGLPKDMRDFISKASDRIGLATSHALRLHSVTFKTSPPVLGHFKSRG